MKQFFCLFFLLLLLDHNGYAQKKVVQIPEGIYAGGTVCENEDPGFITYCQNGFWWLKKDGTFVFISPTNYGTIQTTGTGIWKWKPESNGADSVFEFEFITAPDNILVNTQINYHGETKYSPDSIYISGQLFETDGSPADYSLRIMNTNKLIPVKNGKFSKNFSAKNNIKALQVYYARDHYPVVIHLSAANNVHELKIILPKADSLSCVAVEPNTKYSQSVSLGFTKKKKRADLRLYAVDKYFMIDILNKAKLKQPLVRPHFDALIKLIEQ